MSRKEGINLVQKYDHVKPRDSLMHFLQVTKLNEQEFDTVADKFRDNRVWWIENNKWFKNTIWGNPQSYGEVKLNNLERKKYKTSRIEF